MGSLKDLAAYKERLEEKALAQALALIKAGHGKHAADALDRITITQQQMVSRGDKLAIAYYRRALIHQREHQILPAIIDLEKARAFPSLPEATRMLVQSRMTAIQRIGHCSEVREFDASTNSYFEEPIIGTGLLTRFLAKHNLHKPHRHLNIPFVDGISTVSVYRWKADEHYGETWSKLIRQAKCGDKSVVGLMSRLLAEHFQVTTECQEWLSKIDYVVPVPSDDRRVAERELDITGQIAEQFGSRLGLPIRADLMKRVTGSEHSRHLGRPALKEQYGFQWRKAEHVRDRNILLIDDVVTRGFTASICAELLKAAGAAKVFVLALAQSESTYQSNIVFRQSLSREAQELAPWLCLSDTEKLGPVRIKSLLKKYSSPSEVLQAPIKALMDVPDIGPKLADAIGVQGPKLDEYAFKAMELLNYAAKLRAHIFTLDAPNYPQILKASNAAPAVLYAMSDNVETLRELNTVAIVGSRQPVHASVKITSAIADAFALAGWTVVSGMADGVDSIGHRACLAAHKGTLAFLGNGVDVTYPPGAKALRNEIIRHGALLSEYPFGTRTNENYLRRRNSLTVGASRAVIIIQTTTDGGTMNAARAAQTLGKPLFCLQPIPEFQTQFSGNEELLRTGLAKAIDAHTAVQLVTAAVGHGS